VGDGELNEGQIWEGAQFAPHYNVTNLIMFVDKNGKQLDGETAQIIAPLDLAEKFRAFGWDAYEVDGHDCAALRTAFLAPASGPKCIVANTVKGKGVSYMENNNLWHYRAPRGAEYSSAAKEIGGTPLCVPHS